ncbi:MAG: bicyclomycin resistance protein [Betaproteobacteria bacterium]|nr:bicyclomycin resistance protein [Betaproteobacteria bacterium]
MNILRIAPLWLAASLSMPAPAQSAGADKVLRYAFEVAETSFDPHKVSDVYSSIVNKGMFDTPVRYDHLARPLKLVPNTLAAMPEISPDYRVYTLRIRPGIFFADDAAFGGRKRELVAEDFVYSFKRLFDPQLLATQLGEVEGHIVGTDEWLARARQSGRLEFDAPIEGLKALDRYTFQIKFNTPKPTFLYVLADCRVACTVAREVVEKYGADIGSHPVGTGAYRLVAKEWKRSSKMVFEANPNFREEYFDAEPAADDAEGQAILKRLKGRRIPMVGRVEVSIIEERQPRWISFLNREFDLLWRMPEDVATQAVPNTTLAPNLKKQGIQASFTPLLDVTLMYFNMKDPIVGGYTPDKIALRRAISLAYRSMDEIALVYKGLAIPASTPFSPGVAGYEIGFKTPIAEYNPAKSKALLDMYGYRDVDGDGYREMPDGSPLVLRSNSTPTEKDRTVDEVWRKSMDSIGIRFEVTKGKWPDLLKQAQNSKLMMWFLGYSASQPDAKSSFDNLYGPNCGLKGNLACFQVDEFDRLYKKAEVLPHGPERTKIFQEMTRIFATYTPWKVNMHRIMVDMWYPYVIGFRRPLIQTENWWRFVDIDLGAKKAYLARNG